MVDAIAPSREKIDSFCASLPSLSQEAEEIPTATATLPRATRRIAGAVIYVAEYGSVA